MSSEQREAPIVQGLDAEVTSSIHKGWWWYDLAPEEVSSC